MGCSGSKSRDRNVEEPTKSSTSQRSFHDEKKFQSSGRTTHTSESFDQRAALNSPSYDSSTKSNLPYHEYKYTTADSKYNYESPSDYNPSALIQSQVLQNQEYAQQQQQQKEIEEDPHMMEIRLQQQRQLELYQQQKQQQEQLQQRSSSMSGKTTRIPSRHAENNVPRRSTTPTPGSTAQTRSTTPTPDHVIHRSATNETPITPSHSLKKGASTDGSSKTYIGVFEGMNVLSRDEFVSKYTGEKMFRWRKAEVVYVDGDDRSKVLVHYTGWADTFDYWVDLDRDWERLSPPSLLSKDQCNKGTALDAEQSKITKDYFLNGRLPLTRKNSDSSITRLSKENGTASSGDTRFNYVMGQKLDILDIFYKRGADMPSYKWRSAEIVDMSGTLITIHYENWDSKYDETLHIVQDAKRISAAGTRVKKSRNSDNRSVNTSNSMKSRQLYRSSDVYELNSVSNGNFDAQSVGTSVVGSRAETTSFYNNELRKSVDPPPASGHSRSKSFNFQSNDATSTYDEPPPPYSPTVNSGHGFSIATAIGAPTGTNAVSRSSNRSPRPISNRSFHTYGSEDQPTFGSNSREHYATFRQQKSSDKSHLRQKSDGALLDWSRQQLKTSRSQQPQSPDSPELSSPKVSPSRTVRRVSSNSKMSYPDLNVPIMNDVTYESDGDRSQSSKGSKRSRDSQNSKSSPTRRLHNTGSLQSMSNPDILGAALEEVLLDKSGSKSKSKDPQLEIGIASVDYLNSPIDMPGIDLSGEDGNVDQGNEIHDVDETIGTQEKPLKKKWSFTWGSSTPENGEHSFPTSEQPQGENDNGGKKLKKKWSFTWGNKDPERDVPSEEIPVIQTDSDIEKMEFSNERRNSASLDSTSGRISRPRSHSQQRSSRDDSESQTAKSPSDAAGASSPNSRPVTMLVTHQKNPGTSSLVKDDIDATQLKSNGTDGHKLGDRMIRQFSMLSWSRIFRTASGGPGADEIASTSRDVPLSAKESGSSKVINGSGIAESGNDSNLDNGDAKIRNFELEIGGEDIADEDVDPEGARKAEEEAIRERYFLERLEEKGLHVFEIEGDGNCLFRAISHQLYLDQDMHEELRSRCVDHLVKNRKRFEGFCGTDFDDHVKQMRLLGTWGDDLEIRALEEICDRQILIYSSDVEKVDDPINNNAEESALLRGVAPIKLSYHGQSHYNSIYDERYRLPLANRTTRTLQRARLSLYKGEGGKPPTRVRRPRSSSRNGPVSSSSSPALMSSYNYPYPTQTQTPPQRPYYRPVTPESRRKEYRK